MWALKQLPANLFHDPSIWGLDSRLRLSGEDLFWGILSKRDRLGGVLEGGRGGRKRGGNGSLDVSGQTQKRALLITQSSNPTTATNT